ncbi:winged helix family transcriptional regulator [Streptomyces armeniacus]|uniref:Winged helix family transcriptional regulator n=1 Tax=Streptomyces armeniacus TaxID=83291 RepID=A0A345XWP9_9ACTN|nr:winged helix-turn-helix domain-containing protein [Streptomyces armeniacus]AXK36065.1 winged helix family transcriptional regulator [Streptomyces armeniacus]
MRVLIVDDTAGDGDHGGRGDGSGPVRRGESAAERLAGELRRAGYAVAVVGDDGAVPRPSRPPHPTHPPRPSVLEYAGLVLDAPRRRASREGRPVLLSAREFGVLEVLMRADGAVVSGEELVARVWNGEVGARSNAVRITVSRLRAKLGKPVVVETVPRVGYRLRRLPLSQAAAPREAPHAAPRPAPHGTANRRPAPSP